MSTPLEVAREGIEAFNAGDRDRFRATMADGFVQREHATGRATEGADAAVENAFAWKAAFPDASGEITGSFADGEHVTLQIVWTGTHEGDLHGPDGMTIPATGQAVAIPACIVQRVRDGKGVDSDHYFNLLTMLTQLGVA